MTETTHLSYIVSESPDEIVPADEDTPTIYRSDGEAGEAIKNGYHGEYGTRWVLRVKLTPVATWSRPWTLVRKDADHAEADQDQ